MLRPARLSFIGVAAIVMSLVAPGLASANHSWGGYHWARQTSSFTLKLGDNLTTAGWHSSLALASTDWTKSNVLDTLVVPGSSLKKLCSATSGTVQVCNSRYGNNGWLGVAQIWASGSHITRGTVKLNDTYFSTATYNTPAWRNLVTCQEVGHTFGLAHQDENFNNANLGTCMDYTSDPSTNQHPNAHDYEELGIIYAHLDTTTTVSMPTPGGSSGAEAADWGRLVASAQDGRLATFVKDLGNGQQVVTFVIWA